MTGFILSPAAQADVDGIWDYTAARWSKDQAERYLRSIRDACHELAAGTRRGRAVDIREGYFKYPVGSHFLFFRLTDAGQIDVVRILHQRMDVQAHFQG